MDSIFHRISVRKYQDRPVEQEKLTMLMRAAMAAPSATNQQPWEFYIVTDRALLTALGKATPYARCAGVAPVAIVPCYRKACRVPAFAHIDMSIACENILLEADALGLGACWLGLAPMTARMAHVAELLNLPSKLDPFAIIACGYPDESRPQEDRYDPARVHFIE